MRASLSIVPVILAVAGTMGCGVHDARAQDRPAGVRVVMRTEAGEIEVEIDTARAPVTSSNFLRYVDAGAYTGGTFYRVVRDDNQPNDTVRIDVIQGGRPRGTPGFDPIPLERTNLTGLAHEDGVISMARAGSDTATSEFFICVGAQPELDFGGRRNPDGQGFAAFGRVVRGMNVVRRIHSSPAEAQQLTPAVRILGMARVPSG